MVLEKLACPTPPKRRKWSNLRSLRLRQEQAENILQDDGCIQLSGKSGRNDHGYGQRILRGVRSWLIN